MRFLAFSDTHASHQSALEVRKLAEDVDLLICVGDFSHFGQFGDLFLERIQSLGLPFWFVSGNHDEETPKVLREIPSRFLFAKNLENTFDSWDGTNFCGCSFSSATTRVGQQDLQNLATQVLELEKLIFLTHCPPAGTEVACTRSGRDGGSHRVREFIEVVQPELVLCGHIHAPLQREANIGKSKIINLACQYRIFERE